MVVEHETAATSSNPVPPPALVLRLGFHHVPPPVLHISERSSSAMALCAGVRFPVNLSFSLLWFGVLNYPGLWLWCKSSLVIFIWMVYGSRLAFS
jgi:hypothetical protein